MTFGAGRVSAQAAGADPAAAPVDTTVETTGPNDEARREAATHFRMGVSLYEEGDFQAALAEFERANAAAPSHVVLYNIAQTHLAMRDYVAASDTLRAYLELGGARVSETRRAEVEAQLSTLAMRVGRIAVNCNEDGATITIDGRVAGRTPLETPLRVSSGRHQIVVRAAGREPNEQSVTVAGDTEITIDVTFDPLPPGAVAQEEAPARTLRTVGWVSIGLGIASGITAGTTFGLAMSARSDYQDATATPVTSDPEAALAARDDFRRLSLVSDIMTGVAIVGGGVGLTMLILDGRRDGEPDAEQPTVMIVPTPTGLSVAGRF